MQALGVEVEGVDTQESFEAVFDHICFSPSTLRVEGVLDSLSPEERERTRRGDQLPNSRQPSDHLLQAASFTYSSHA